MRALWFIALCSIPLVARGATVELEVGPGFGWSTNAGDFTPEVHASTPLLRARAGVDIGWFTPSLSGVAALFQDPGALTHSSQEGGLRFWGIAGELRFHTQGMHRIECGLGAGWGQLIAMQAANGDSEGYRGHPAPYVEGSAGYRFVHERLTLGVDLTVDAFNRVDLEGDLGVRFCVPSQCPVRSSFFVIGIALWIGWRAGDL